MSQRSWKVAVVAMCLFIVVRGAQLALPDGGWRRWLVIVLGAFIVGAWLAPWLY